MSVSRSTLNRWMLLPPPPVSPVHLADLEELKPCMMDQFDMAKNANQPVTVNNLVIRVETDSTINFLPMFGALTGVHRKRIKFPQAKIRYGNVSTDRWETMIVYRSGRYVLSGMRTKMTAIHRLQSFRLDMHQSNMPVGLTSMVIVNNVGNATIPFDVDIKAAHESRRLPDSALEQKDFPGMTFKMRRVQVLAFANGECVLTGSADLLEMYLVRSMVEDALRPFALERATVAPAKPTRQSGVKSAMRAPKGSRAGVRKTAGKEQAAGAEPGAGPKKGRRTRVVAVSASAVQAEESRLAGRARGVAFKLTEKLIIRPNEDMDA